MKRGLNICGTLILAVLLVTVLPLTLPKLLGLHLYEVQTGSMEPTIPVHSVIYTASCDPAQLNPGDIITFRIADGSELVETHRITAVDRENRSITTRGDANETDDHNQVLFSSVVGKVVFHIPYLGTIAGQIHSAQGIAVCISLFATVAIMWMIADRLNVKERVP